MMTKNFTIILIILSSPSFGQAWQWVNQGASGCPDNVTNICVDVNINYFHAHSQYSSRARRGL